MKAILYVFNAVIKQNLPTSLKSTIYVKWVYYTYHFFSYFMVWRFKIITREIQLCIRVVGGQWSSFPNLDIPGGTRSPLMRILLKCLNQVVCPNLKRGVFNPSRVVVNFSWRFAKYIFNSFLIFLQYDFVIMLISGEKSSKTL